MYKKAKHGLFQNHWESRKATKTKSTQINVKNI